MARISLRLPQKREVGQSHLWHGKDNYGDSGHSSRMTSLEGVRIAKEMRGFFAALRMTTLEGRRRDDEWGGDGWGVKGFDKEHVPGAEAASLLWPLMPGLKSRPIRYDKYGDSGLRPE